MKNYTIELTGRGAECYVFPLTDEQIVKLKIGGVVDEQMDIEDVCQVLGVESIQDSDSIYTGLYDDSDLYSLRILNEDNELVEDLTDNWNYEMLDGEDYIENHYDEKNLIVEDTCKGHFFNFALDIEEDFDSSKLSPIITEIGECVTLITGLRYGDQVLSVNEYGDYWSKGFYFYLT